MSVSDFYIRVTKALDDIGAPSMDEINQVGKGEGMGFRAFSESKPSNPSFR
jgi:hypothetical protein